MITADRREAETAMGRGEPVVLIVGPDAVAGTPRPGRLAVLVGDAHDPAAWEAARAMERELFAGGAPTNGR